SRAQRNARQGVPREASRTKDLPGGVSGASPMRTQTRSLVDPQYDHLFTERERDIVHRLLASESTRTIAEKTGLTVSTVNTYVKRIRKKVGARGRVELLARVVGSENIREMVRAADLTERERDVVGSLLAGA